ncbi:MAG: hypothetical protein GF375_07930 [Candidatus Omnitrophica bacterium]|nr:hypothetical protein [Candidatus Omnitrophota bacterium]
MRRFTDRLLIVFSFIHRRCPLCMISRRFPRSKFAKVVSLWTRICPCCNIYFLAKKRNLI